MSFCPSDGVVVGAPLRPESECVDLSLLVKSLYSPVLLSFDPNLWGSPPLVSSGDSYLSDVLIQDPRESGLYPLGLVLDVVHKASLSHLGAPYCCLVPVYACLFPSHVR